MTSGGDAPGMNAAIRAVVRRAIHHGSEVVGVRRGYLGLIEGEFEPLPATAVSGIINRGGTILLTARCPEFKTEEGQGDAVAQLRQHQIDGVIVVGGDGSLHGAHELWQKWQVPTVGIPGSIDNDLAGTDFSIGFDTAVNTALDAIDKIRDTAVSHDRIFVVEVMGRDVGFIALEVGLAGGAEAILVPEIPFETTRIGSTIKRGRRRGKTSYIIVVAEGAARGIAVAADIEAITGAETRATVLGHLQRGGAPTAADRVLATRLGAAAVDAMVEGRFGVMVGMQANQVVVFPLETIWTQRKTIDTSVYELAHVLAA
ncbi:MAG: 6-phosphofructokinase [Armatimonadota bacterium]|nr:MAG: 6-phosphofructokinase [Armatimonadota bacterium]